MKKFKKILAMGLATVMALSVMSIGVFAENTLTAEELFHGVRNECGTLSDELEKLSEERTRDYTRLVQLVGLSTNDAAEVNETERNAEIKKNS